MKTVNSQSSIAQRMVEKYLKLSDFIIYIFSNFDVILDEPEQELKDYLAHFLISLQDCVDFEITIQILIKNEMENLLIDLLFDQTDDALAMNSMETDKK